MSLCSKPLSLIYITEGVSIWEHGEIQKPQPIITHTYALYVDALTRAAFPRTIVANQLATYRRWLAIRNYIATNKAARLLSNYGFGKRALDN